MILRLQALLAGDGMKARAIRGTALSVVGFGGSQVIRLGSNLVLTRILFPEAFGLLALVLVLLAGLEMFSDLAIGPSIVRSPRGDDPKFLDTAWTLQIIRGVVLWLAACALALPVARFYDQPEMIAIIPVIAVTTVIQGFQSTRIYTANRHLMLGWLTVMELTTQITGAAFMILLAFWLQSVWALVFGMIAGFLLKTVLSHVMLPGLPNRLAWDRAAFFEIFHFGKYIFFGTIAGFLIQQGDRMVLGKFVSLEALAVYTIAFMLASAPMMLNGHLLQRILFPLYRSHPPAESPDNRRHIGQARLLLVLGAFATVAMLALIGSPLVAFLYDPRYHMAGPFLVLLSLTFMPRVLVGGYDSILLANGNSRDFTIFITGTAVLKVIALLILVARFGMIGAVVAPVLADVLTYPLLIWLIRPYGGWYPRQDMAFGTLAVAISVLALWLNPAARGILLDFFAGAVG